MVRRKFISYTDRVIYSEQRPHDYGSVLTVLRLLNLTDRRVSANLVFIQKLIDGSILEILNQLNFKIPIFHSRLHYSFFHTTLHH
jgi:hypothetical protein